MVWLIALPVWAVFWSIFLEDSSRVKIKPKTYMILCSVALIFVMGLRSKYTGTMDTYMYASMFEDIQKHLTLGEYLDQTQVLKDGFLLSEVVFSVYTWVVAQFFSNSQWFLLLTSAIIVLATGRFISRHSENPLISWIVFICLGSMTFAMNGMRQALAMSICLLSYRYARENKLIRFLLLVLLAVLFHKSAMIFALVYLVRNMKANFKSFVILTAIIVPFFAFVDRIAILYDSIMGEDYALGESFESGGLVTILIYIVAIVLPLFNPKRLTEPGVFAPWVLVVFGLSLYVSRFLSTAIYERISYYFFYFLMLIFASVFRDFEKRTKMLLTMCFCVLALVLFAYRIGNGVFADFRMFW